MGTDERERAKSREDEPDVEAHRAKNALEDEAREPEDKSSDDTPDVEAHVNKH